MNNVMIDRELSGHLSDIVNTTAVLKSMANDKAATDFEKEQQADKIRKAIDKAINCLSNIVTTASVGSVFNSNISSCLNAYDNEYQKAINPNLSEVDKKNAYDSMIKYAEKIRIYIAIERTIKLLINEPNNYNHKISLDTYKAMLDFVDAQKLDSFVAQNNIPQPTKPVSKKQSSSKMLNISRVSSHIEETKKIISDKYSDSEIQRSLATKIRQVQNQYSNDPVTMSKEIDNLIESRKKEIKEEITKQGRKIGMLIHQYYKDELSRINLIPDASKAKREKKELISDITRAVNEVDLFAQSIADSGIKNAFLLGFEYPYKNDMVKNNEYHSFIDPFVQSISQNSNITDDKLNEVINALNKLETSIELQDWLDAKNLIAQLPDGNQKLDFYRRYKELLDKQANEFDIMLNLLLNKMHNSEAIDPIDVAILSKRFELLVRDKKQQVKGSVMDIIEYNNACIQDERKEEIAKSIEDKTTKKYSIGNIILEFIGMPVNWIRRSHSYLSHIVSKRDRAINNGKNKKADRYNKIYLERDIVSGPVFYLNVNKLNSMKPVLYRNGYSLRSSKTQGKYFKTMATVYNKMNKSVDHMVSNNAELDDIVSNKQRAINVVNQFMEMISMYDINKQGSIVNDSIFNGLLDDVKELLLKLKNKGTFDDSLYLAYLEELDNIVAYKDATPENRGYEYFSDDIDDISKKKSSLPFVKEKIR